MSLMLIVRKAYVRVCITNDDVCKVVTELDDNPENPPAFIRDTPNWAVHLMTMVCAF